MTVISKQLEQRVHDKLKEVYAKASAHFSLDFKYPVVLFDKRGKTAGTAHLQSNKINLNAVLFTENVDDFITRTVTHEAGHLIDFQVRGTSNHDWHWKSVMRIIGGPVDRCHTYDVSNSAQHKMKYVYTCNRCQTKLVAGPVRHKKMVRGYQGYTHSGCGGTIKYDYSAGRVSNTEAIQMSTTKSAPVSIKAPDPVKREFPNVVQTVAVRSGTKKDQGRVIFDKYWTNGTGPEVNKRGLVIEQLRAKLSMTPAGAATYFNNYKSNRW